MASKAAGAVNTVHIFNGVGHFQLEQPGFSDSVAAVALDWLRRNTSIFAVEHNENENEIENENISEERPASLD